MGGLTSLNSPNSANFMPQLGGTVGGFAPSNPAFGAIQQPVSLPGAFPVGGIATNNFQQAPSPVGQFPGTAGSMGFSQQAPLVQTTVPSSQFQQQPMSMTSLPNDALDLFGSSTGVPAAPVLQPAVKASNGAIPSNSASNNINNNSNPSLKVSHDL